MKKSTTSTISTCESASKSTLLTSKCTLSTSKSITLPARLTTSPFTLSPKEIFQKRLTSKLMSIPLKELNIIKKEDKNSKQNAEKHNYRTYNRDIKLDTLKNPYDLPKRVRVFTKVMKVTRKNTREPFIMTEPKTICDIDNDFYKIIEGRPVRPSHDIKVYMMNLRDVSLYKANATFLKDKMIQIEYAYRYELKEHNNISKLLSKTQDNFIHFLEDSFKSAKNIQTLAEMKYKELEIMSEQLEATSFNYVKIRNELSFKGATFEVLVRYRQFLNSLSPLKWRLDNDQEYDESSFLLKKTPSVDSIDMYMNNVDMLKKVHPKLYFKNPMELMNIFDDICRQCLNNIVIEGLTANMVKSVLNYRDYVKIKLIAEIDEMQDLVNVFEGYVKWIKEEEIAYKDSFYKLLFNGFQRLFASYDTTKLFTCAQFVNTQLFHDPEDTKDSIVTLMTHIERHYIELTSGLDNLNQEIVKKVTNEFFAKDLKMMNRAHKAQRTLKEFYMLSKSFNSSFEPPRYSRKR